ncbi:poly-gamma-glutamate biosynthesis protein PgsC [bacterium]|nr:poly-gamma-glutamate biosynthesis protein PgsC [bacterium]
MITNIVTLSITIGLIVSLIFSEFFGIAAGGMVVPGYMALFINKPTVIVLTLLISFLTYFIVHSLSSFMIIYGRRRTVLMILIGFILGWFIKTIGTIPLGTASIDLNVVGYIIPGLIAIWIDRQGAIETYSALITSSIVVRLILLLVVGAEVL